MWALSRSSERQGARQIVVKSPSSAQHGPKVYSKGSISSLVQTQVQKKKFLGICTATSCFTEPPQSTHTHTHTQTLVPQNFVYCKFPLLQKQNLSIMPDQYYLNIQRLLGARLVGF